MSPDILYIDLRGLACDTNEMMGNILKIISFVMIVVFL